MVVGDTTAAARWPAWFAPAGLLIALGLTLVLGSVVTGIAIAAGVDDGSPVLRIGTTLAQDIVLVATALAMASHVGHARPRDFGLRPVPARRAMALTLAALAAFYIGSAAYSALVRPDGEQDVLEHLGADRGAAYLVIAAAMVIVLAPIVEELFFRGFVYRSLRNQLSPLAAASTVGLIFGAIHYSGPETLELLPVLAVLGAMFCWLYEATGSLYPAIAVHVVNNTLAFTITAGSSLAAPLGLGLGAVTLAACIAAPARQARDPA